MRKWLYITLWSAIVLAGSVYLENYGWIGQGCDSSSPEMVCDKKPTGSERSFFLALDACQAALKGKFQTFLCASGPNSGQPDVTIYSSFRNVYYSGTDKIETRNVSLSYHMLPLAIGSLIASILVAWGVKRLISAGR